MNTELITVDAIKKIAKLYGFKLFTGLGNVNIWGIRVDLSNEYNDVFIVFELDAKKENFLYKHVFEGCTHPGKGWLGKLMGNPKGTFILKSNRQYIGCWQIGYHRGYKALTQIWNYDGFLGYRDNDQDEECDIVGKLYNDVRGLNFHCTDYPSKVAKASAGCQVVRYWDEFNKMMDKMHESSKKFGNKFSYTLVDVNTFNKYE